MCVWRIGNFLSTVILITTMKSDIGKASSHCFQPIIYFPISGTAYFLPT